MAKDHYQGIRINIKADGIKIDNKTIEMPMIARQQQRLIVCKCQPKQEQRQLIKLNKIGKKSLMNLLEIFHKKKLIYF